MVDYISIILLGVFNGLGTGLGAAVGLFVYDKYIKPKLEHAHIKIEEIKKIKVL